MKLPFQIDLKEKVVVVTGAGGVICSVLAEAMAMTGAKVALLDLNEEAAKKNADAIVEKGYIAKGYKCNVLEKDSVKAARDLIAEDFGTCDILINGAGGNNPKATTDDEYFHPEDLGQMKTFFDLDADGKEEEMSFVGKGSGFLALDKNGDGTINDGSELFGTQSGDGFKDLAAYDKDGNGWIDEADDIFKDLKVWTKDEEGNNKLLNLKEAGVGAIYLGSADTQFSLNNEQNKTNAVIRKTGIYLKESGEVGTVQHVDFAL